MNYRILIAVAALLVTGQVNAATVVAGGFERPAVGSGYRYDPTNVGVTFNAGSGVAGYGSAWNFETGPEGSQVAFIQSYTDWTGSISLDVTDLVVGKVYAVSFYLAQRAGYGVNPITLTARSGAVTSLGVYAPTSIAFSQFVTGSFIAGSGTATLDFVGSPLWSGDYDTGIDWITVTEGAASAEAAVPEPATWALMLLGFGGVGYAMRHRPGRVRGNRTSVGAHMSRI